jgi:mannose-6-phosphate isomerase-like protein (cupin superfamily)
VSIELRPWGSFELIETQSLFQIKKLVVKPGKRLSLQTHEFRSEHWFVLSGNGEVQKDEELIIIGMHDSIFIPVGSKHRVTSTGDTDLVFIEIQTGVSFDENDIVRYEDDFGRA